MDTQVEPLWELASDCGGIHKAALADVSVNPPQPGVIGGAMKRNTAESAIGIKLFPIAVCCAWALFLAVLMLNGTLHGPWMFLVAPCVMAGVAYYIWKANSNQSSPDGGTMKRISTPYTFVNKLFPFLFFGFCAFFVALLLMNGALQKAPVFVVFPCLIAAVGYYAWKTNIRDLMDEVYDCGDYLLVKKRGEEDTVLLSNIINVSFSSLRRGEQPRINITLASPGKFGTQIAFAPLPDITFPHRNEIAEDLLARVNKARSVHTVYP